MKLATAIVAALLITPATATADTQQVRFSGTASGYNTWAGENMQFEVAGPDSGKTVVRRVKSQWRVRFDLPPDGGFTVFERLDLVKASGAITELAETQTDFTGPAGPLRGNGLLFPSPRSIRPGQSLRYTITPTAAQTPGSLFAYPPPAGAQLNGIANVVTP